MYGTVARMRIKPGLAEAAHAFMQQSESRPVPGAVAVYLYQMDADPNEIYMAVVFDSKESYRANADSPEQDAEYRQLLSFLDGPPEWHDGEILFAQLSEAADAC
jgi:quinol monooxygenase YgiN